MSGTFLGMDTGRGVQLHRGPALPSLGTMQSARSSFGVWPGR
jgi:hypothetical protein